MQNIIKAGFYMLISATTAFTDNPVRLSSQARMDIMARPDVGSITDGKAKLGDGWFSRMDWVAEAEQRLTYTASWPVRPYAWSEIDFTFIPQSNGGVMIDLIGPADSSPSGALYRQEVLWDAVTVTGSMMTNGSFEVMTENGALIGWSNPWSGPVVIEHGPDPVDGTNVVNVWHNRRVQTTLAVEAGKPVEIRAWVRARIPDGFVDNPVITDRDSAAFRAAGKFKRGINFSNYFDAPVGEDWGGGPLVDADFDAVKSEGFDHVRLPVSWNYHTGEGPSFTISNDFFARVDTVITGLMARGINVIVNMHHFREFYAHPDQWTNKLYAIWDQVASHYSGFPDGLAFEILNEPHDQATTEFMNGIYAHLLPRIRTSNPSRTIFVGPGHWNSISQLPALRLPVNDANLIVTVHCYDPFYYTHQGASWSGPSAATTNVVYPGPPPAPVPVHPLAAKNAGVVDWFEKYNTLPTAENPCSSNGFNQAFQEAKAWSDYYGRPIHVGEFGAFTKSDPESRVRFYREMRESLDRHGLGWAAWDWKAGFNYWDRETGAPVTGMRHAFFPK